MVLQTMEEGTTITNACRQVGMPRSTFYSMIHQHPEILGQFQASLQLSSREQLMMIIGNRSRLLRELLDKANDSSTSIKDRLAIFKTMEAMLDKMVITLGIEIANNGDASEVLSGPVLVPAQSRFAAVQVISPEKDSAWD